MLTNVMKSIAIAALLGGLFWHSSAGYGIFLQFAVTAGAIFVFVQAAGMPRQYVWMGMFLAVACLFNPILPVGFPTGVWMVLNAAVLVLFAVSLHRLKTKPRLALASITDRVPGIESL